MARSRHCSTAEWKVGRSWALSPWEGGSEGVEGGEREGEREGEKGREREGGEGEFKLHRSSTIKQKQENHNFSLSHTHTTFAQLHHTVEVGHSKCWCQVLPSQSSLHNTMVAP